MNRRIAITIFFLAIISIGMIDLMALLSFTGSLNKIVNSISKFEKLYSQNTEMKNQLSKYGALLKANKISVVDFKKKVLESAPDAVFKISGDTLTLQNPVRVNPYKLLNMMASYTNVDVISMHFGTSAPVFYEYEGISSNISVKYVLDNFTVNVYGE